MQVFFAGRHVVTLTSCQSHTLSPHKRPNLAILVCKYLKYLSLQRTASGHTSTSYANDLGQYLGPIGVQKILYTSLTPVSSFQAIANKNQAIKDTWDEKTILELIQKGQASNRQGQEW